MSLSLKLLGSVRLEGPDGPLRGRATHRRRLAILALLSVPAGRSLTRERIITLLWPEAGEGPGRRSLTEALYELRKELGENLFLSVGEDLRLNDTVVGSDAGAFETAVGQGDLEQAVALYGGPFLDGWYVEDAPDYERWASGERERLERLYVGAVEALAEKCADAGEWERAAGWWRRLWALDPHSSRNVLGLMRALDRGGDPAAAFRIGETHTRLVRDEVGVEPAPEMTAYMEKLCAAPELPVRPRPTPMAPPASHAPAPEVDVEVAPVSQDDASKNREREAAAAEPSDPEAPLQAAAPPRGSVTSQARRGRRSRRATAITVGAAFVSLLLFIYWETRKAEPEIAAGASGLDPRRIAVLYFDDYSPGGSLSYLASGLTESLIHELSQVEALEVVSRNGVKPYRDRAVPLDSIVRALRVGSVVEGSVQQSGDSIRVVVQLVDAGTGRHLESREVKRASGDLLRLEEAVAREVSSFLRKQLGQEVRLMAHRAGATNPDAFALVLRAEAARDYASRLASEPDPADASAGRRSLVVADSLLAVAEARDPRWADPSILRGWVTLDLADLMGSGLERKRLFDAALDHAQRALVLDPQHPSALQLRGTIRWKMVAASSTPGPDSLLNEAEHDLRAAVEGDASLAGAWSTLSQLLRFRGALGESYLAIHRALEEDAYFADEDEIVERLYRSALVLERYPEARRWCSQGEREFPGDFRFLECRLTLLTRAGDSPPDPAAAWRVVAQLDSVDPPNKARLAGREYNAVYRRMMVAAVLARAGETDSARAVLARARRSAVEEDARTFLLYDEAYVYLLLKDRNQAIAALRRYLTLRPFLRAYLSRDPVFRELHDDPRFKSATSPG